MNTLPTTEKEPGNLDIGWRMWGARIRGLMGVPFQRRKSILQRDLMGLKWFDDSFDGAQYIFVVQDQQQSSQIATLLVRQVFRF